MDDYLDWLRIERGLSANTIMAYQRDLNAFMCSLPEGYDLANVDEKCVDRLARSETRTGASKRTQSRQLVSLRGFFQIPHCRRNFGT